MPPIIVEKIWGSETWLVNNALYCLKILVFNPLSAGSLHYHRFKDETFVVKSGQVQVEIGRESRILRIGDTARIPPKILHRVTNRSVDMAELYEVSTHHDDDDVVRVEQSSRL